MLKHESTEEKRGWRDKIIKLAYLYLFRALNVVHRFIDCKVKPTQVQKQFLTGKFTCIQDENIFCPPKGRIGTINFWILRYKLSNKVS